LFFDGKQFIRLLVYIKLLFVLIVKYSEHSMMRYHLFIKPSLYHYIFTCIDYNIPLFCT
jgi:hypothetical protein